MTYYHTTGKDYYYVNTYPQRIILDSSPNYAIKGNSNKRALKTVKSEDLSDKKISHYEFHSNPYATPRRIVKKKEEVQTNHLPINCDCSFCTKLKCDCHSCNPRRFCRCKYCFPLEKENYKPLSSFKPVHDNDIYTNRDKVQVNTF